MEGHCSKTNGLFGAMTEVEFEEEEKLDTIHTIIKNYVLISTHEEHHSFIETLMQQKAVAFDTETTSLEIEDATLLGISFSFNHNEGYYCNLKDDENQQILNLYQPFFQSDIIKIAHNLKYDFGILFNNGIHIKGPTFDTMIAHYLIDAEQRHNLDHLSRLF